MIKINRLILLAGLFLAAAGARADETPPFLQADPAAAESSRSSALILYQHIHDGADSAFLRDVLPETDSAWDIGALGREWRSGYFDGVTVSTIAASSATITSLSVTTATITNIVSSSVGTNQIAYNNGTKLVGSSALTFDGATIGISGTLSISGTWDGWVGSTHTWTYISSTQFSMPGDQTGRLQKGDRLKLTQTTVKYFYVTATAAGVGVTTFTVTGGSDYTLASAAITAPYYSKVQNPQGFPQWFNYAPTYTGFSANPTGTGRFTIQGKSVTVALTTGNGTSNSTAFTLTLPVASANSLQVGALAYSTDNGTGQLNSGRIDTTASSATATVYKDLQGNNWTAAGNKQTQFGNLTYEF